MNTNAFDQLLAFRNRTYMPISRRADTLFGMLDALLAFPSAIALAHMMMPTPLTTLVFL